MTLSSDEARARGRIGNHVRWASEPDRVAATEHLRRGLLAKYEREVDPHGVLSPQERAVRAEHARLAHLARASRAGAIARRKGRTT